MTRASREGAYPRQDGLHCDDGGLHTEDGRFVRLCKGCPNCVGYDDGHASWCARGLLNGECNCMPPGATYAGPNQFGDE